ncbi:MAG TPA: hypothetical protein VFS20_01370 [Longimicrobium sp.]|nr:hypothetical protein [Longimicrobium sp.]
MEPTQIDAVAMTRRIREAHAEQLKDASPDERIRCFREKARRLHASLVEQGLVEVAGTSGKTERR